MLYHAAYVCRWQQQPFYLVRDENEYSSNRKLNILGLDDSTLLCYYSLIHSGFHSGWFCVETSFNTLPTFVDYCKKSMNIWNNVHPCFLSNWRWHKSGGYFGQQRTTVLSSVHWPKQVNTRHRHVILSMAKTSFKDKTW